MKKLTCLLVVLALAAIASAADIDVYTGGSATTPHFQDPYSSGPQPPYETYPLLWYDWFFDHTHPIDGLATARAQGGGWKTVRTDAATSTYAPPTTLSLAGNRYLEFDAYFYGGDSRLPSGNPLYRKGRRFEAMHLQVNSDAGWTYKWQTDVDMWVDDVYYSDMGAWTADANDWVHIKIDLLSNMAPLQGPSPAQIDLYNDTVGLIRFYVPVSADFHIRDMAFTPEPATIALLGLGGLALFRRKRS